MQGVMLGAEPGGRGGVDSAPLEGTPELIDLMDLPVEVAWRTHMLSPVAYTRATAPLTNDGCTAAGAESDCAARLGVDLVAAMRRQLPFMHEVLALTGQARSDDGGLRIVLL